MSQRLGREEGNPLSGQRAPTQMWHSSVGYLIRVCIGVSFDPSSSVKMTVRGCMLNAKKKNVFFKVIPLVKKKVIPLFEI